MGWTPHEKIANQFGSSHGDVRANHNGRTVSAWIPESQIHHVLPQAGSLDGVPGRNEMRKEHEVIVNPHSYNIAKDLTEFSNQKKEVHNRVNERQKIHNKLSGGSLKFGDEKQQAAVKDKMIERRKEGLKQFNSKAIPRTNQKLAASEKIDNNLMKAPVQLDQGASDNLGKDFKGTPSPEYVKGHVGSYQTKDDMYHHVIESKMGGLSHYLSTSKDPWDEKSQVAKIQGSPSMGSFTVTHSSVRPEHKGKGYGKKLYMSTLAHHGDMQSDNALTERSHNAWKSLKDQTKGVADVSLANMGEKGTRHRAVADKTKMQEMLHKKRIAPSKPGRLAASEQDVLFKSEKGDYTIEHEHEDSVIHTGPRLNLKHKGKEIGHMRYHDHGNHLMTEDIDIHPDHQRKGHGTKMYQHAEKLHQKKFKKNPLQSKKGKSFWNRPKKERGFGKMEKSEKNLATPASSVKLNPEHGKMIADAYEKMPHTPNHPETQKAYGALIDETKKQFHDIMGSGIKLSRIEAGQDNPYKNSKELHHDIKNNNHLHFFPTDQGFGSDGSDKSDHPMMQGTGIKHNGKELLANDLFRIVHDINGHHRGGESGFGAKGEHQAYNTHKQMYSPLAQKALASETLGQNSWVNFGPHGEHNRANPHQTKYAEQKAGLLPDHIISGNWHSEE